MLAILICNAKAKVKVNTFIFKTNGLSIPNVCPYDNQLSQSTCDATSPNNPPITKPAHTNSKAIHTFLSKAQKASGISDFQV